MATAFSRLPFLKEKYICVFTQKMWPLKIDPQQLVKSNRITTAFKFDSEDIKMKIKSREQDKEDP